jgi:hypothetical protein
MIAEIENLETSNDEKRKPIKSRFISETCLTSDQRRQSLCKWLDRGKTEGRTAREAGLIQYVRL